MGKRSRETSPGQAISITGVQVAVLTCFGLLAVVICVAGMWAYSRVSLPPSLGQSATPYGMQATKGLGQTPSIPGQPSNARRKPPAPDR